MNTTKQHYRVDRRHIIFIRFIFEAYEGVAVVTTLDAAAGKIVLSVSPQCENLAACIMRDLGRKFLVEANDQPPAGNQSGRIGKK